MVRSVAGDLPEQVKNNQSVNMAAGNGGQEISQYSWFTVYDRQRESLGCFPSPETKMPADLKDQLAFLFAHKENALLRFYKYNKYTKHNSIPTKHLKIMFFDKVH
mgnify:CR=1 FL=1